MLILRLTPTTSTSASWSLLPGRNSTIWPGMARHTGLVLRLVGVGVRGDELVRAHGGLAAVGVREPLEHDLVAALDRDVERAAGRAGRRGVPAVEVTTAVHAVPLHGHEDDLGPGPGSRAARGRDLEGLLEGVGHDAVHRADPHPDPGDRAALGAALDRLQDALAVAHLVHGDVPLTSVACAGSASRRSPTGGRRRWRPPPPARRSRW